MQISVQDKKSRRSRRGHGARVASWTTLDGLIPTARSNHVRWFDPTVGRWLSEDPSGLGPDSNPYRYVHNACTIFVDPAGLFPWVAFGAGVAAGVTLGAALPDWAATSLTGAEQTQVDSLIADIKQFGDQEIVNNISQMTVTGKFKPGWPWGGDPSVSETRYGRFFGLNSTRTILSSNFFCRCRKSQIETLLHESYHAGTRDFTEVKSYDYARNALERLGPRVINPPVPSVDIGEIDDAGDEPPPVLRIVPAPK